MVSPEPAFYHDSAAALVVDGRIVAAAHVGERCQQKSVRNRKTTFLHQCARNGGRQRGHS